MDRGISWYVCFVQHLCEVVSISTLAFFIPVYGCEGLETVFEWVAMIVDRVKRGNMRVEYKSAEAGAF